VIEMNPKQFRSLVRQIKRNLLERELLIGAYFPSYALTSDMEEEAMDLALAKMMDEKVGEIFG
jgi:hypothetical protein